MEEILSSRLSFAEEEPVPLDFETSEAAEKDRELVAASFFDADAMREAPRQLYRHDGPEGRFYYTLTEVEGEAVPRVRIYPSVTTVIRGTTAMPPFLLKWIADYGQRRAEQIRDEKGAYGTLLHVLFGEFMIAGEIGLDGLAARVIAWAIAKRLPWDTSRWAEMLRQDLVGLVGFLFEKDFHPIGVEVPLASDELGYAGCIDLVGRCGDDPFLTLADFKSNRISFYEEQEIQVAAYRDLWNENFPKQRVERLMLFGSKDWDEDSRERYRLRAVKESPRTTTLFPTLLRTWDLTHVGSSSRRPRISGTLRLSNPGSLSVAFETLEESLASRRA